MCRGLGGWIADGGEGTCSSEGERAARRWMERECGKEKVEWGGKAGERDTRTEGGFPRLRYRHHRRRGGLYPGLSNTRKSAT